MDESCKVVRLAVHTRTQATCRPATPRPAPWIVDALPAHVPADAAFAGMGGGVLAVEMALDALARRLLGADALTVDAVMTAATGPNPFQAFIAAALPPDVLPSWIAEDLASKLKFADALPDDLAIAIATARLADLAGVARVISEPIDAGVGGP